MSRIFELLIECEQCRRHGFGSVWLYLLNQDLRLRFCSGRCKTRYLDTHPSERGESDPRFDVEA